MLQARNLGMSWLRYRMGRLTFSLDFDTVVVYKNICTAEVVDLNPVGDKHTVVIVLPEY
jgi:hypothetical protein